MQVTPQATRECSAIPTASTVFIVEGSGVILSNDGIKLDFLPGQAFFVPARQGITFTSQEGSLVYRTTIGKQFCC